MQPLARVALVAVIGALAVGPAQAAISDLDDWTLVEDPADPSFDGTATPSQIILTADGGPIPASVALLMPGLLGLGLGIRGARRAETTVRESTRSR